LTEEKHEIHGHSIVRFASLDWAGDREGASADPLVMVLQADRYRVSLSFGDDVIEFIELYLVLRF
jgi:hypothetical protein